MLKHKINLTGLFIAITVFIVLLFLPVFDSQKAQYAFALLAMVAILWITESIPLPLTSLLIPVGAIFLQLLSPKDAFTEFANPILFLFMGGFVLAGALSYHSLDKMLAQKLIKLAGGNFYRSAIFLMLSTALTAFFVSNTSSTAMMIPLALGMLVLVDKDTVSPESKFLMLGIAYSANIGGIVTIISSPPNAIGAAILNINFLTWLKYSVPIFLITFPVMITVLTLYFKPDRKMSIGVMTFEKETAAPLKTLIFIFLLTVILWMMDGILSPLLHIDNSFNSLVAIFAIFLIYITKVLSWDKILKSINWEILLLFGGGLTLGFIIEESGLGEILIGKISSLITLVPIYVFLLAIVIFSIILTEFMSNTASAAMMLPLLFSLATQLEINPVLLLLPATIAASFGFMMPAGTPPNAMVFSSGYVPQKDMLKAGLIVNVLVALIVTTYFYFIFYH
ncbi:SLC13 family permease [Kaistella antarctica]|uniref:Na(+)/dicarboxylate symporter n=1 Tax=Kaistella antarctica TaxID=266748 RepID=A0A448NUW0_9FLAO|nr:DASS family sodium-coupled anion symporter [Kaistella antarctica]SEV91056.1 solute carrier family 13 (sodium-dependent dicarboxylate transporter), member 2/3/5 [Kaistella antarctica]VEI01556.1 Na(+)/dicarboxylate symporter [Kaistella antarctica]